jgi:hypothetical protein
MNGDTHRIRRSFVIPLTAVLILIIGLLALSFFGGTPTERVFLALVLIPLALVWSESLSRRVSIGADGITLRKFLRPKTLRWEDITHVGCLVLRKKVYLLLTTGRGFHILSNEYERFADLARGIATHLDREKIEAEVLQQAENPTRNPANIAAAWAAAAVLAVLVYLKLFPA